MKRMNSIGQDEKGIPDIRDAFVVCDRYNGRLLLAEDALFAGLRDAKLHDPLGRDLDGFPGLGVPAHAGLAIHEHELTDAGQREGILRFLVCQRRNVLQDLNRNLLLQVCLLPYFSSSKRNRLKVLTAKAVCMLLLFESIATVKVNSKKYFLIVSI